MSPKRMYTEIDAGQPTTTPYTANARSYDLTPRDSPEQDGHMSSIERRQSNTSDTSTNIDPAISSRKRSEPVKSACGQCQKRKTKCSGQRPTCGFCSDRGLECSWEIGDGLTRNADLRQRLSDANSHSVDINILVHNMRTNTDAIATTLLAKLRLGDSIEDLATELRAGTSFAGSRTYPSSKGTLSQTSERPSNSQGLSSDEELLPVPPPYPFEWPKNQ